MPRTYQFVLLVAGVIAAIVALLAIAVVWGPHPKFPRQFPKIIGWALGTYEGLAGGLIAAGGALVAGWLAWSAARDQIAIERSKLVAEQRQSLESRVSDARMAVQQVERVKSAADLMLNRIRENLSDPSPMAKRFLELWKQQPFPSVSALTIPGEDSNLSDALTRVRLVAQSIAEGVSRLGSADQVPGLLLLENARAQFAHEEFAAQVQRLPSILDDRRALLKRAESELATFQSRP